MHILCTVQAQIQSQPVPRPVATGKSPAPAPNRVRGVMRCARSIIAAPAAPARFPGTEVAERTVPLLDQVAKAEALEDLAETRLDSPDGGDLAGSGESSRGVIHDLGHVRRT